MSEGSVERGQRRNETQLESHQVHVPYKRYYVDLNENQRGKFIKINEIGSNYKTRVILSLPAAEAIKGSIDSMAILLESPQSTVEGKESVLLKSDSLTVLNRRFYVDLKDNERGRFLRIAQMPQNVRQERQQVVIPSDGIKEIKEILEKFLDKYYDKNAEEKDMNSKNRITTENKTFQFTKGENDRGQFLRISEVKLNSGFRSAITIPLQSMDQFREALNEALMTTTTTTKS